MSRSGAGAIDHLAHVPVGAKTGPSASRAWIPEALGVKPLDPLSGLCELELRPSLSVSVGFKVAGQTRLRRVALLCCLVHNELDER